MSITEEPQTEAPAPVTNELKGDERAEFLQDAHEMIDWLQANPGIPLSRFDTLQFRVYDSWIEAATEWDDETNDYKPIENRVFTPAVVAKAMRKADKDGNGSSFELRRRFGRHGYTYCFPRTDVCTKKVVGTKEVQRRVPTDEAKIAELQAQIDALHVEQTVTEDVIEYDCPKTLLAGDVTA